MSEHVTPFPVYLFVFLALLVLTGLTAWIAFFDLGIFNNVVALGIAILKGTLVVLFFMHVAHSSRLSKLVVVGGFVWLILLFGLTLTDYLTRGFLGNVTPVEGIEAPPGVVAPPVE
ncbi:MAG: cytochrome C oxidase subunit IV family protein [Thermoanaerobaculia bacterium]